MKSVVENYAKNSKTRTSIAYRLSYYGQIISKSYCESGLGIRTHNVIEIF